MVNPWLVLTACRRFKSPRPFLFRTGRDKKLARAKLVSQSLNMNETTNNNTMAPMLWRKRPPMMMMEDLVPRRRAMRPSLWPDNPHVTGRARSTTTYHAPSKVEPSCVSSIGSWPVSTHSLGVGLVEEDSSADGLSLRSLADDFEDEKSVVEELTMFGPYQSNQQRLTIDTALRSVAPPPPLLRGHVVQEGWIDAKTRSLGVGRIAGDSSVDWCGAEVFVVHGDTPSSDMSGQWSDWGSP